MKIVLDTNIFVSALLRGGKPREVLERVIEGKDVLCISRAILSELFTVLNRPKFRIGGERAELYLKEIEDIGEIVTIKERIHALCRDVDDNAIVECAVAAGVGYLISGDEDLLSLGTYRKVRMVTAGEYLGIATGT